MRSISLYDFQSFIEIGKFLIGSIKENYKYENNKRTDEVTSVSMTLYTENFGELQAVWEYKQGLIDELKKSYPFASVVTLEDLGSVNDIKLSIYKEKLLIKIFID